MRRHDSPSWARILRLLRQRWLGRSCLMNVPPAHSGGGDGRRVFWRVYYVFKLLFQVIFLWSSKSSVPLYWILKVSKFSERDLVSITLFYTAARTLAMAQCMWNNWDCLGDPLFQVLDLNERQGKTKAPRRIKGRSLKCSKFILLCSIVVAARRISNDPHSPRMQTMT